MRKNKVKLKPRIWILELGFRSSSSGSCPFSFFEQENEFTSTLSQSRQVWLGDFRWARVLLLRCFSNNEKGTVSAPVRNSVVGKWMLESPNQIFSLKSTNKRRHYFTLTQAQSLYYEWKGRVLLLLYFFVCFFFFIILFFFISINILVAFEKNVFSYLKLRICQLLISE